MQRRRKVLWLVRIAAASVLGLLIICLLVSPFRSVTFETSDYTKPTAWILMGTVRDGMVEGVLFTGSQFEMKRNFKARSHVGVGRSKGEFNFGLPSVKTTQLASPYGIGPVSHLFKLPLWPVVVVLALPTVLLSRVGRRPKSPGHCSKCGYDLHMNKSGRCPECGTSCEPVDPAS